jgi:hypothetical protein
MAGTKLFYAEKKLARFLFEIIFAILRNPGFLLELEILDPWAESSTIYILIRRAMIST